MDRPNLNVVLYQPEIPQNTGNIGRTCVAIGAKLWIVRPTLFRLDDRHLRRAGLDYWQYLHWQDVANWEAMETHLVRERAYFFTKHATQRYTDIDYRRGDFLVFGKETLGMPAELLARYSDRCVSFPMTNYVRSLNLSNCVAAAAYEAVRQWGGIPAADSDETT